MTAASTEEVTEVWEVEDLEVPCDFGDGYKGRGQHDDPARWIVWTRNHGCGSKIRLICDDCKDRRMCDDPKQSVECVDCGRVTSPPCVAYSRVEALK